MVGTPQSSPLFPYTTLIGSQRSPTRTGPPAGTSPLPPYEASGTPSARDGRQAGGGAVRRQRARLSFGPRQSAPGRRWRLPSAPLAPAAGTGAYPARPP